MPYYDMESYHVNLEQVLQGCRQNQRVSQQRPFAHFYNYAMTIGRRYMGSEEMAEEVVNDAFFKVFTKIHLYAPDQPFRPWLRRVLVNTAIDRLRTHLNIAVETEIQPWHDNGVVTGIEEELTREQIWGMLDRLPPAYRAVFNLAVVDGFSHEEIAAALQISVGASKSNLSRARQYLKNLLKSELELF
ncbi:MAG: RNA polymerase sigma factor [Saprospiraceae bacterium]|nr:RNA polymerase sigma factor [Saprospiraceae bacterium]